MRRGGLLDRQSKDTLPTQRSVDSEQTSRPLTTTSVASSTSSARSGATTSLAAVSKQSTGAPAAAAAATSGGNEKEPSLPSSDALKQALVENQKLRAQLQALKDQGTNAEDSRRQARIREERLTAERDDYKQQVQELQEQIKEVMTCCWCERACKACGLVSDGICWLSPYAD